MDESEDISQVETELLSIEDSEQAKTKPVFSHAVNFQKYINSKAKHKQKILCPVCGDDQWIFTNPGGFLTTYNFDNNASNFLQGYPTILLTCGNCSYFMPFFSNKFLEFVEEQSKNE